MSGGPAFPRRAAVRRVRPLKSERERSSRARLLTLTRRYQRALRRQDGKPPSNV